jgi:hypothetical protein
VWIRSIFTLAVAATLLVGSLLVPTAAAVDGDVPTETLVERLDGLVPATAEQRGGDAATSAALGVQSAPAETPIAFSMVGFELPEGTEVAFRTSVDGTEWTPWQPAHRHDDDVPDPGSQEDAESADAVLSAPAWVGEARWLQTRVVGGSPDDVAVHLIDSAGLSRSLARRFADAVAAAWRGSEAKAVPRPAITTRAQWGADESLRTGSISTARRARVAFVHHTVNTNNYGPSDGPAIVRGIYAYHVRSNGWSDIGYNLLVDRYGRVYEGRAGGVERAIIGAHAGGFNTGTFGVAMIGDFQSATPPAAAVDALAHVLAWKMELHHIDPLATWQMTSGGSTRYPAGTAVTLNTVAGHRDVSATACPGGALYSQLPALRQRVDQLIGAALYDHDATPSTLRIVNGAVTNGPVRFATRLRPAGAWTLEVRDPRGNVAHTAAGAGQTATSTWSPAHGAPVGRYTYTFSSPGRLPATDYIDLLDNAFTRLGASGDPVAGSVEVSQAAFPDAASATRAVVARADLFADALAGGPLAGTDGPVLLTGSSRLDFRVRAELDRLLPAGSTVYVLGGAAALSDQVAADLSGRWTVRRLAGPERSATAAEVARVVVSRTRTTIAMVARAGPDSVSPWADALAGGAYGAAHGIPVLLTPTDRLAVPARDIIRELSLSDTLVLGGTAAVSDAVARQLPRPRRVSGVDRTATAVAIAEQLWGRTAASPGDRLLLSGAFRADAWTLALSAAPLAARNQAPLLLSNSTELSSATGSYLDRLGYRREFDAGGWVLGSQAAVSDGVVAQASGKLQ